MQHSSHFVSEMTNFQQTVRRSWARTRPDAYCNKEMVQAEWNVCLGPLSHRDAPGDSLRFNLDMSQMVVENLFPVRCEIINVATFLF